MLVFVAAQASLWWEWRLLLVAVCGLLVTVGALVAEHKLQALWASVLAVLGLRCLQYLGSVAAERRLRSRGAQALLPRGMWDLPRPMTEPLSPALAGRFSTTGPPGKAYMCLYIKVKLNQCAADLKLTA